MSVEITELVIIESLPADDVPTAKDLHTSLSEPGALPIPVSYGRVHSVKSLLKVIQSMCDHAEKFAWWKPIVHFEAHGDARGAGFVLASGEFLAWEAFAAALRRLNIIVKNSVVLVLGTCSGAFVLKAVATNPYDRAPFYGVIGPDRPVLDCFLPIGFRAFYISLLSTGNFAIAVQELRERDLPEYGGYDCAHLFRLGLARYKEYSEGEHLIARVEEIMRRLPPHAIAQAGGRDRLSEVLARQIRESAGDRDTAYRHFIMTDLYPENEERFPSWDSVAL